MEKYKIYTGIKHPYFGYEPTLSSVEELPSYGEAIVLAYEMAMDRFEEGAKKGFFFTEEKFHNENVRKLFNDDYYSYAETFLIYYAVPYETAENN